MSVKLLPPPGSSTLLPQQYVDWLADTAVAEIGSSATNDGTIGVELLNGKFVWHWAGQALRISPAHMYGAKVANRSFQGSEFISFVLSFGKTRESGGVFLVTAGVEHAAWFRELARLLESLVPGGVQWSVT